MLCEIIPDDDLLPVRSRFDSKTVLNTAVTYLKSIDGTSLWYTLPDLLASKLLSGKTPVIKRAIRFIPVGIQDDLREIEVTDGVFVHPNEDIIKKTIEERIRVKEKVKRHCIGPEKDKAALLQSFLKVLANSTAYGEFIEMNVEKVDDETSVTVYGLTIFNSNVKMLEK